MGLYEDFVRVVKKTRYVLKSEGYYSTFCIFPGCYRNCHERCNVPRFFSPSSTPLFLKFCKKLRKSGDGCSVCGHLRGFHRHNKMLWDSWEEEERQADKDRQQKFNEAKSEKEKMEILMEVLSWSIEDHLKQAKIATAEVGRLVKNYAGLALTGSFHSVVDKSIELMEVYVKSAGGNLELQQSLDVLNPIW